MAEEQWVDAGGGSADTTWDRQGVLKGKYIGSKADVGPNKSMLYTIEVTDEKTGEITNVGAWGSTVLDDRFEEIPVGSKVRIEALGKKESKNGKTFTDFKVQYIPPEDDITETANTVFNGQGE